MKTELREHFLFHLFPDSKNETLKEKIKGEDYEMAVQLNFRFSLANLNSVLVKYRLHDNNISSVFAEKMKLAEKHVFGCIHKQLGIEEDPDLIEMHHSLVMSYLEDNPYSIKDYKDLFIMLKNANEKKAIYTNPLFNKMVFSFWYNKIRELGEKKAMFLFFDKSLFSWGYITFKMLRKMFKQTFW